MAITKILPVRGQLKGCLDYAANPQKTEYFSTADMQRLVNYTQNGDKTEHQLYVSGFNSVMENPPFFDYGKGRQHFLLSPLDYPFAKPGGAVNGGL